MEYHIQPHRHLDWNLYAFPPKVYCRAYTPCWPCKEALTAWLHSISLYWQDMTAPTAYNQNETEIETETEFQSTWSRQPSEKIVEKIAYTLTHYETILFIPAALIRPLVGSGWGFEWLLGVTYTSYCIYIPSLLHCTPKYKNKVNRCCECSKEKTKKHVIFHCFLYHVRQGIHDQGILDENMTQWLLCLSPNILSPIVE